MVNKEMGVPSIVIGVPVRYIHSSNCFVKKCDYDAAVDLALELVKRLDKETVESL